MYNISPEIIKYILSVIFCHCNLFSIYLCVTNIWDVNKSRCKQESKHRYISDGVSWLVMMIGVLDRFDNLRKGNALWLSTKSIFQSSTESIEVFGTVCKQECYLQIFTKKKKTDLRIKAPFVKFCFTSKKIESNWITIFENL